MSISKLNRERALLPEYSLFRSVCNSGLSQVRPLGAEKAKKDEWGWNFGSGWPPSYWAYGRMRALTAFLEAAALKPKSVLEVAAGDAALSASLAKEGYRVVANDLRGDNLSREVAYFTNADNIEVMAGNLFDLDPAKTGLFDLLIACEILEHVAHTVDFLCQLKRFVAPGGHILLTTPNGAYFRNTLPTYSAVTDFSSLECEQFKPDADGHLFLITPDELGKIACEAGLAVDRMTVWGTPLVTGHLRLSKFACRLACWSCYRFESILQQLPFALREKLCFSLYAVLALA